MQAGLEQLILAIVVEEQIICACHLILSTVVMSGVQGHSYMYGAEYQHPIGGNDNEDATCAVCYVSTLETQLMLPAKTSCPTSWIREYYGYLMSTRTGDSGHSSFVCVDGAYETVMAVKGIEILAIYTM
jgi:hypothetical protein